MERKHCSLFQDTRYILFKDKSISNYKRVALTNVSDHVNIKNEDIVVYLNIFRIYVENQHNIVQGNQNYFKIIDFIFNIMEYDPFFFKFAKKIKGITNFFREKLSSSFILEKTINLFWRTYFTMQYPWPLDMTKDTINAH